MRRIHNTTKRRNQDEEKIRIRLLATLLVILMLGTALTGCGGTTPPASTAPSAGASSEAPSAAASSEGGEASTEPEAENPFAEHITIDMYNNAANYQENKPAGMPRCCR
jgi:hypothetical protein